MGFLDLFVVASMPVLKVLLITALGLYLALDHVDVMGEATRKQMNRLVYLVFNPALVASNLANTITSESILLLWFMPINILLTFVIGSALGWILIKVTRAPRHLKGLILGCCAAGNLGNLPLIIVPAVCKEKGSPFGDPDVCQTYGLAYASLSMAIGAIYLWSYVYNIVRISSNKVSSEVKTEESIEDAKSAFETHKSAQEHTQPLLSLDKDASYDLMLPSTISKANGQVTLWHKVKQCMATIAGKINLGSMLTPSTSGAMVGFAIGLVPFIRHLMIGTGAPLRVFEDTASLLGGAAIPCVTLIMGGNLLRGMRGSGMQLSLIVGVLAVRYILLPLFGIAIVKGALYLGLIHFDPLYMFILLLQFALPPAMNIGTITQLFGAGESECSVVMLWTYALASVALTLWSTFFMWLVS
ncbi:protein PIN-LIKES 3-like [Punica granatum]|uniref:Protein PIN-LIKES 3-like n=1 Tax=Punica granatum TaxID=22663 RepID=A0A218W1U5_PUNGR|nr:protein PIN-LIKES 3-like [Punica granatum]OWM66513.1 hypothetical protein CDL15_Pgr013730 [Punica granatum]